MSGPDLRRGRLRPRLRARAGRLRQRPRHRPQGHHRDPLHRPRPGPRRHPLLPLRLHGRRDRGRPQPLARHVLQGGARRPGPRRRQGRHHRRPGHAEDRGAAARLRPVRPVARTVATTPPATSARAPPDMDHIARECDFVTGRTVAHGGAGDSSVLTAYGVFQGMRAAAEVVWGAAVAGRPHRRRRRGRQGRPAPGAPPDRGRRGGGRHRRAPAVGRPGARGVPAGHGRWRRPTRWSPRSSTSTPRARWAARITDEVVEVLSARIVCGAANNQLAHPGVEKALEERGILYAPDYCVNSGGLIQVADELEGFSFERAQQRATGIFDTTRRVFELAAVRRRAAGDRRRPARRAPHARRRSAAGHLAGLTSGSPEERTAGHASAPRATPPGVDAPGASRARRVRGAPSCPVSRGNRQRAGSVAPRLDVVRPLRRAPQGRPGQSRCCSSPCSSLASAPKSVS